MKTFIVYQTFMENKNHDLINLVTVIRKVGANTKKEAIQKFLKNTANIVSGEKGMPDAKEISQITAID